jgi:hypothetical protein
MTDTPTPKPEEAPMNTTAAERDVRDFARQFPTPAVLRGLALCESGRITWEQMADLAARTLASALKEVSA